MPGGVGIVAMRLSLPEGASIRDRDGRDLVLGHVRVMADTEHKVDTSVRSSSEEVRSKRGRRSTATDNVAPVLAMDASRREVNAAKLREGVPLATGAVRVTDNVALQTLTPVDAVVDGSDFTLTGSERGITTVVIDGSTYALVPVYGDDGVQIIDISDPFDPQATALISNGNEFTALRKPRSVATAVIDGSTYALVAAYGGGVQIIDISTPSSPQAIAAIKDGTQVGGTRFSMLAGAFDITTVVVGGRTYALVVVKDDDGVQIIDISDPSTPKAVAALEDGEDGFTELKGATDITTVVIDGKTYALVAASADAGVQIIDISDPSDPKAVAALEDGVDSFDRLNGAVGITAVTVEGRVYALVAAYGDDGVQIIDISDPFDPKAVTAIEDGADSFDRLDGAWSITTVVIGGRTYALVAAYHDDGVQIIDISDPFDPQAVTALEDGVDGFDRLKGAVGVTTVTVEGRVYALVTAYNDDAVQFIELPVLASIASIEINTEGLDATGEKLLYGSGPDDFLLIGGANTDKTGVSIAGIDGLELTWSAQDKSITIGKADSNALTTIEAQAIIAALRYAHGDADGASEGARVFTFVLRDTADNVTALNQQVNVSVEVDKTPPAAPKLDLNEDTGDDDSDRVTSNGAFTVSDVEAGSTWEYSVDGGVNWQPGSGSSFTVAPGRYSSNRIQVRQVDRAGNASVAGGYSGALEVLPVPSTRVAITAITDDTGTGGDFITEDGDGLVLQARLSAPLKTGERLEYTTSTDSGSTWPGWADISTSVSGVRVVHEDRSLTGSPGSACGW